MSDLTRSGEQMIRLVKEIEQVISAARKDAEEGGIEIFSTRLLESLASSDYDAPQTLERLLGNAYRD